MSSVLLSTKHKHYNYQELQTALMLAVSSGNLELVTMFIDAGANINEQDKVRFMMSNGVITRSDVTGRLYSSNVCMREGLSAHCTEVYI